MTNKHYFKRGLIVVIGSFIMGIGIYLTMLSQLGNDPLTMFWIGVSKQLSLTVGQANLLVSGIMLFIVFFFQRKELSVGSLLNPVVIALTTDLLVKLPIEASNWPLRLAFFLVGIVLLSFGVAFYALADFGRGAYEAVTFTLIHQLKLSVRTVRIGCDLTFAIAGILLGAQLSIGPVLAILLMGTLIQFFIQRLVQPIQRYLT
ncbi:YczE/YyaS/YitT family protein [Enterococcus lemanii]|uniref:YitT family protein n=1 Tax=Enterococcus lemanii TaxID=1159752 RepID=A0ABV9MUZ9_9ENTE|nr:hypothetical protein [Enterococcus lemanii]MBM7709167.1 putative membrane protein YczE [Enterococcus lemanii]